MLSSHCTPFLLSLSFLASFAPLSSAPFVSALLFSRALPKVSLSLSTHYAGIVAPLSRCSSIAVSHSIHSCSLVRYRSLSRDTEPAPSLRVLTVVSRGSHERTSTHTSGTCPEPSLTVCSIVAAAVLCPAAPIERRCRSHTHARHRRATHIPQEHLALTTRVASPPRPPHTRHRRAAAPPSLQK